MASILLRPIWRVHARPLPRPGGLGFPRQRAIPGERAASAANDPQPFSSFIHPTVTYSIAGAHFSVDHIGFLSHNLRSQTDNSISEIPMRRSPSPTAMPLGCELDTTRFAAMFTRPDSHDPPTRSQGGRACVGSFRPRPTVVGGWTTAHCHN